MNAKRDPDDRGVNDPRGNIKKMDPKGGSHSYADIPEDGPGLTGGPSTEAVPGTHQDDPLDMTKRRQQVASNLHPGQENDGGESLLSGRPRETGGERP